MANETVSSGLAEFQSTLIAEANYIAQNRQNLTSLLTRRDLMTGNSGVRFPYYAPQTAGATAEGSEVSNSQITSTGVTLTPGQNATWATTVTDLTTQTTNQQAADFGQLAADAIIKKKNADIFALFDGFSTALGSTGVDLTAAAVKTARKTLIKAGAVGELWLVITPEVWDDLMTDLATTGTGNNVVSDRMRDAIMAGVIDSELKVWGVNPVVVTSGIDESGDVKCGLFERRALGYAPAWDFKVEIQRNAKKIGYDLVVSSAYAVGEISDVLGIELLCDGED